MNKPDELHWLVQPKTIRRLWWGLWFVLGLIVAAQLVFSVKGYFGVDGWFGFGAAYGFLCCLGMVFFAKLLGKLLKRPAEYYQESDRDA